ncbi:hypothetical protein NL676_021299 [Syzygium grande]|nr:hypothetical protein NL676_021299 [Syzygium grande]
MNPDSYDHYSSVVDPHNLAVVRLRALSSLDLCATIFLFRRDVRSENLENEQVEDEACETELTKLFDEEHEVRVFFEALDEELNKVNQFYESRKREFLDRGVKLEKQLQILQDLKRILSERRRRSSSSLTANGNNEGSLSRSSSGRDSDFSSG